MKKLPKISFSKLSVMLLAAMCLGVLVYDLAGSQLPTAMPAQAQLPADIPDPEELPAPEPGLAVMATADDGFYAEYRLQREQVRAEELELLQGIIEDINASKELRDKAGARKMEIAQNMEYELMTENVLFAKKFGQTVVMLGQDKATVILSGPFDEIGAAQVAEAVSGVTGVAYENVIIISR